MKINLDNPVINVLGKITDLMLLNVITIILCIPIVTAGAALTALNYCCIKMRREEDSQIYKMYFHSFRINFGQSTGYWLIMLVSVCLPVYLLYNFSKTEADVPTYWIVLLSGVLVLFGFLYIMVFPVQSKFGNTFLGNIKTAFVVSISNAPKSLLMIILVIAPFYLTYNFMQLLPITLMFGFSLPAFISALLFDKTFRKLEKKAMEDQGLPEPGSEDAHIFEDPEPKNGSNE